MSRVALVLALTLLCGPLSCRAQTPPLSIQRVVDGDTFVLSDGSRVRLIGVDTPEKWESAKLEADARRSQKDKTVIQALGQQASDFATHRFEGKAITLKTDPLAADRDKYGRLLRYVYLVDGTCVNATLIREGYATAYTRFPFTKMDEFVKAEREARAARRGLWSGPDFAPPDSIRSSVSSPSVSEQHKDAGLHKDEYWLNTKSNVRHNSSCPQFGKTSQGKYTRDKEGRACGKCGG